MAILYFTTDRENGRVLSHAHFDLSNERPSSPIPFSFFSLCKDVAEKVCDLYFLQIEEDNIDLLAYLFFKNLVIT